ncbi:MAG TPA: hypothetical protein VGG22_04610 [Candidatus Baltobacteraceae bacterium]|jgi:hypothetical protein
MGFIRWLVFILLLCISPQAATASLANDEQVQAPTVHVGTCRLQITYHGKTSVPNKAVLYIGFVNDGPVPLSGVTWRVNFGAADLDFTARGNFEPGKLVAQRLFIDPPYHRTFEQYYAGLDEPRACRLVAAQRENGSIWRDPAATIPSTAFPTVAPYKSETVPAIFPNSRNDPVGVLSCKLVIALNDHGQLWVRFRNLAQATLRSIVFRAHVGTGGHDFVDAGNFSTGALVQHWINSRIPEFPASEFFESIDQPSSCDVVTATYANGSSWTNPSAGPAPPPLPTPNTLVERGVKPEPDETPHRWMN